MLNDSLFTGLLLFYAHFTGKQTEAQEDEGSTANQGRAPPHCRPSSGTAQCTRPQIVPLAGAVHACTCWGRGDAQRLVPTKARPHCHCPIPGLSRQSRERYLQSLLPLRDAQSGGACLCPSCPFCVNRKESSIWIWMCLKHPLGCSQISEEGGNSAQRSLGRVKGVALGLAA